MHNGEQTYQPLPMNDDIIVKLPEGTDIVIGNQVFQVGTSLYNSSKVFLGKVAKYIYDNSTPHLFIQGIKVEILKPGKQWTAGKLRCRLVFEFIPDHSQNNTHSEDVTYLKISK